LPLDCGGTKAIGVTIMTVVPANTLKILYVYQQVDPPKEFNELSQVYDSVILCYPKDLSGYFDQYLLTVVKDYNSAPALLIIFDSRLNSADTTLALIEKLLQPYFATGFPINILFLLNSNQRNDFEEKQDTIPVNCQFFYADEQSKRALEAKINQFIKIFTGYRQAIGMILENLHYQRQIEYSHNAIVSADLEYKVRSWNPAATRTFGWTAEEAIGKDLWKLFQLDILSNLNYLSELQKKGYWEGEAKHTTKDGKELILSVTTSLVKDAEGKPTEVIGITRDITKERQKEEILAERTRELSLANKILTGLISEAPIGIVIFNAEGLMTSANPAFLKMCGVTEPTEIVGKYNLVTLPEMVSYQPYVSKAFKGEAVNFALKMNLDYFSEQFGTKGGKVIFNVYLFPVHDSENKEVSVVSFVIDETEAKNLQKQLEHSQKLRSIGTLAGGIAHDFNNMLTALFMLIGSLREKIEPDSPLYTELEELNHLGKQANGLTERLLLFTRQKLETAEPSPFNRIILDSSSLLRRTISEDIEFKLDIDETVGMVVASNSQLSQVLVNLVINARDALKDAEISQKFTGQNKRIKVSTFKVFIPENTTRSINEAVPALRFEVKSGWYAGCRVEDNGIGIPTETLPLIFDPFFTSKELGRGSGLGLPICYNVIKNYEGWLELDNRLGDGVAFSFFVPLMADNCEAQVKPVMPQTSSIVKEQKALTETHVLLVEDEEILRVVTTRMLRKIGFQVVTAKNGVEALAVYEQYEGKIDLVLTDTVMPEMGGVELIKKLRDTKPELAIVLMSGYIEGDDALHHTENITQIPGLNFIAKPFKINELEDIINKSLSS
jgi:two-component system cell cycle sensor histidine kinase/response regulator CckA